MLPIEHSVSRHPFPAWAWFPVDLVNRMANFADVRVFENDLSVKYGCVSDSGADIE